jgi:hypothetical protein
VAEMFGREDKSLAKHEINRGITRKISYVGVAIITLNYLTWFANHGIYYRINGYYNPTLDNWTDNIIPGVFLLVDCILLFVALVWICHSLRQDPQVMGNEKWMAVHSVLLVLMLGSYIWYTFFFGTSYISYKTYAVTNTIVYLLMAFIMDQVNRPQYTVWANKKFVGKNKDEVAEYILHNSSTINEEPYELMNTLNKDCQ